MVLEAQLAVTRDGMRRWQAEQLGGTSLVKNPNVAADDRTASLLDGMENGLASVADGRDNRWAG